jgi:hypothetical protein
MSWKGFENYTHFTNFAVHVGQGIVNGHSCRMIVRACEDIAEYF